jgi:hypothetical protein
VETARAGALLLTFDGQVLELFGWLRLNIAIGDQLNLRLHVAQLAIEIDDPDRKGRRRVTLKDTHSVAACDLVVEEADWPAVGGLLERVRAALTGAAPPPPS